MSTVKLSNLISLNMPEEVRLQILAMIAALQQALAPYLVDIGMLDLRGMILMGDRNVSFVTKTLNYLQSNPHLCPPYLDVEEFARDLAGVTTLRSMEQPLQALVDQLKGSGQLCGADAVAAAYVGYGGFQAAARQGQPGASTIVNDLSDQFAKRTTRTVVPGADDSTSK